MSTTLQFKPVSEVDVKGKKVLLRLDINSPLDPSTGAIVNTNRIDKSAPLVNDLIARGAAVAIIAHQGDTLDYQNLISLEEHAGLLGERCGLKVDYIDDVCGPSACDRVEKLQSGQVILLGNLRYLTEEVSTFENDVKQNASEMGATWLIRRLAPLFDLYVNEAFSAAHRNSPSMVGFQQQLPSAAGPLFFQEISVLDKVLNSAVHPVSFLLGGAKVSDAFGMLEEVLSNGCADHILTGGVTAQIFLAASGIDIGAVSMKFLKDHNLMGFIGQAKKMISQYPDKIELPSDLVYESDGKAVTCEVSPQLAAHLYGDLGAGTVTHYNNIIKRSGTIFVNGPAGIYENPIFEKGTADLWKAVAASDAFSVIGGGDSVSAAARYIDTADLGYVCSAGGAMVQYLSGKKLPLIEAMNQAALRSQVKSSQCGCCCNSGACC